MEENEFPEMEVQRKLFDLQKSIWSHLYLSYIIKSVTLEPNEMWLFFCYFECRFFNNNSFYMSCRDFIMLRKNDCE